MLTACAGLPLQGLPPDIPVRAEEGGNLHRPVRRAWRLPHCMSGRLRQAQSMLDHCSTPNGEGPRVWGQDDHSKGTAGDIEDSALSGERTGTIHGDRRGWTGPHCTAGLQESHLRASSTAVPYGMCLPGFIYVPFSWHFGKYSG